jgi:hypothetical protein
MRLFKAFTQKHGDANSNKLLAVQSFSASIKQSICHKSQ